MSWQAEAAFTASSYWLSRSRVCTSPEGQPVVAMIPSECSAISSRSIRGLPAGNCPSKLAREESRKRLRSPCGVRAHIVM